MSMNHYESNTIFFPHVLTFFLPVAVLSLDIFFTSTNAGVDFAGGIVIERPRRVAGARTTTVVRKVVKVRLTPAYERGSIHILLL